MRYTRVLIFSLALLLICDGVFAQRLIPGQWNLEIAGVGYMPFGAEIGMNKVDYNRKMLIHVTGLTDRQNYVSAPSETYSAGRSYLVRDIDILGSWGYSWRFAGSRNRRVNLWGGVTIDAGARVRKPLAELTYGETYRDDLIRYGKEIYDYRINETPSETERIPSASFIFGFTPELEFEVFPANNFSIALFGRPHLQWYAKGKDYSNDSKERVFNPEFGLKFNFYFFFE